MAFSSDATAAYLDPSLWEQKIANQASSGIVITPSDPLQNQPSGGGGGPGSIKPGSMVDRARLAMVPLPEAGLRCPRCDSTNTKFCYFNNYNLSQPRHFCKGCRRYWTRGGTLRNVPVGGTCRRNKRRKPKKAENSKTPVSAAGTNNNNNNTSVSANDTSYQMFLPPPSLPDPFFPGLSHLNGFGLNWGGGEAAAEFEGGVSRSVEQQMSNLIAGSGGSGSGLYPFYESGIMDRTHNSSGFGQLGRGLKVEENHQGLSLSKSLMAGGVHGYGTDQYTSWGDANGWTGGNSGFHSSS